MALHALTLPWTTCPASGLSLTCSPLQIFGICLAQNLVSDIKAVKANW